MRKKLKYLKMMQEEFPVVIGKHSIRYRRTTAANFTLALFYSISVLNAYVPLQTSVRAIEEMWNMLLE